MAEDRNALIAQGRAAERADVLAFLERKGAAALRVAERDRDDGAALLSQRLLAIHASIAAALHEGEADVG